MTNVPVTPGINLRTYNSESSGDSAKGSGADRSQSPSYFRGSKLGDTEIVASPDPIKDKEAAAAAASCFCCYCYLS